MGDRDEYSAHAGTFYWGLDDLELRGKGRLQFCQYWWRVDHEREPQRAGSWEVKSVRLGHLLGVGPLYFLYGRGPLFEPNPSTYEGGVVVGLEHEVGQGPLFTVFGTGKGRLQHDLEVEEECWAFGVLACFRNLGTDS